MLCLGDVIEVFDVLIVFIKVMYIWVVLVSVCYFIGVLMYVLML